MSEWDGRWVFADPEVQRIYRKHSTVAHFGRYEGKKGGWPIVRAVCGYVVMGHRSMATGDNRLPEFEAPPESDESQRCLNCQRIVRSGYPHNAGLVAS